jgi:hypothetical protein
MIIMGLYYDRDGRPIDVMRWAELFGDPQYKRVALHWIRGWMVSSVWLGLDHNFFGGTPLIFETMVFPPGDEADRHGVWSENYQERYPSEAAALAGHDRALAWIREKLPDASEKEIIAAAQFDESWSPPDDISEITPRRATRDTHPDE